MTAAVGNIHNIAALIRSDLLAAQHSGLIQRKALPRSGARGKPVAGQSLAQRLANRIAAISLDDPQAEQKAFKAFIEAVLLNELGDQLLNDPGFAELATLIADRILAEPAMAGDVQAAMAHLVPRIE